MVIGFGILVLRCVAALPDPLSAFASAGHNWPLLPCRTYVGSEPAQTDGQLIFTPVENALIIWNDRSCSKNLPAADVRMPRKPGRQERIKAIAMLPSAVLIASFWAHGEGMDGGPLSNAWSMFRFYSLGEIGGIAEPMLVRNLAGKVLAVLACGDDVYVSMTDLLLGRQFLYCFLDILHYTNRTAMMVQAPEDLDHLLPFEDHIVALSSTKIFMIPRDFTFNEILDANWTAGKASWIKDACIVENRYLALLENNAFPFIEGKGGHGGSVRIFDLKRAAEVGLANAVVMEKGYGVQLESVAAIEGLGFVLATRQSTVVVFRTSDIEKGLEYNSISTGEMKPAKMLWVHGTFLAVASPQRVTIIQKKLLYRRGKRKLAPLVLPVESAVVDLLELPGLGLAVATYHQVHFFGDSATYGASGQEVESIESVGGVSLVKALSQRRFLVASPVEPDVAIYSWSFYKVRLEGYLQLDHRPDSFEEYTVISSCEITDQGIVALGLKPEDVMIFNISGFQDQVLQTESPMQLIRTQWRVQAMATDGSILVAADEININVITLGANPRIKQKLPIVGTIWDLVWFNGLFAAAFDLEEVVLYHYTRYSDIHEDYELHALKSLKVEGQAFALRPLGDTLLVATSMYLEIFEAHALNEKEKKSISMARLPVNAMVPRRDLEVENSLGVLEDAGLLIGLDLYRPNTFAGICSPGYFSPPGTFECLLCPSGWQSFRAAGSCDYPNWQTIFMVFRIMAAAAFVSAWVVPQCMRPLQISKMAIFTNVVGRVDARPYFLISFYLLFLCLCWRLPKLLPLLPFTSATFAGLPAAPGWGRYALLALAGSSLASALCCFLLPSMELSLPLPRAIAILSGCNLYHILQLRCWLQNSFVNSPDGIRANTAGVRTVSLMASVAYVALGSMAILCLLQNEGHAVWTPLTPARLESSLGKLPFFMLAWATLMSLCAKGLADQGCMEAEELDQPQLWARDEKVPPARLPRHLRYGLLLRFTVLLKSWRCRHLISLASALYDSYTFYKGLQRSRESLSSQFYDFAVILFFAFLTASINAIALLLDHLRVRAHELGDRTFRLSTLCKCCLLFMKLRMLKVPLVVNEHMDVSWFSQHRAYAADGDRIPIWVCQSENLCPITCKEHLQGNCTYAEHPGYSGCFCEYWSVGIPIASDRGMVFLNCLISAMVIALLTYSKMHTRGLFSHPELSLFALGCCTFLPTAFITLNTIYLSVPSFARQHVDFPTDFLVLTIPALIFVVMANEMARRIETAWKLRFLRPDERVTVSWMESSWQVVLSHGLEHMMGVRVDAVDSKSQSLLSSEKEEIRLQGPAVLLSKDPPRYGSLWVSSGFRALTPVAHLCTALAIVKVWDRLYMPVISADVLVLLILSLASGVLNFTLMDGEWRDPRHRPSLLERQVELQGA